MIKLDTRCLKFIGSKVQELAQDGMAINLINGKTFMADGQSVIGTFCPTVKQFKVAMGDEECSMGAFVHEYCHYLQWKYDRELWDRCTRDGLQVFCNYNPDEIHCSRRVLKNALHRMIEFERDCEMLSIECMKEHDLPIDMDLYIRRANACLLFYHWEYRLKFNPELRNTISDISLSTHMPDSIQPMEYYLNPGTIRETMKLIEGK